MQMFHRVCQHVEENLLPVSDAGDKQFHEMKNITEEKVEPSSLSPQGSLLCTWRVHFHNRNASYAVFLLQQ